MISVDIAKRLDSFALNVAFEAGGGVTALFGRSGAGKSTIVKAIAGLVRPERGRIQVGEVVLFDAAHGVNVPAERRRAGVVFQDGRLFPHLNVKQNLLYGFARAKGEKAIDAESVIRMLGIEALLERKPATLSGGERQRVAVGRALLAQPRVLLMDEPLASLDVARKGEVLPYLEELNARFAIPIIYVTHDADEVLRLASDVVLLAGGTVAASGTLAAVTGRLDLPVEAEALGLGVILEGRVDSHDAARGLSAIATPLGAFRLPLLAREIGARVAIRVAARDVSIALERPAAISVQNMFDAVVEEVRPSGPHVARLAMRAGEGRLLAELTADAVVRLKLDAGARVVALVKAVALAR
ncbi:MAG: molybdenum ABC transporter ATP-binding protein [Alphaproteobacteria bacterium]|nr:molybdenum ABC transporter ATP-binding protein [Alphaproteobacteria bacterium]